MPQVSLEERVTVLESLVAGLLKKQGGASRRKNWRDAAGMFPGHAGLREIAAAGAAIRKADREAFRKSQDSKQRRKRTRPAR